MSWGNFSAEALLRALVAHGVDFVVVGGIAMVLQGSARLTQDLDICFAPTQPNLDALGAALIELGAAAGGSLTTPRSYRTDGPCGDRRT